MLSTIYVFQTIIFIIIYLLKERKVQFVQFHEQLNVLSGKNAAKKWLIIAHKKEELIFKKRSSFFKKRSLFFERKSELKKRAVKND